ncbi:L-seryl-tRNA(Sec) selenium transferase [Paraferrimonas sedimenticola]|uniref:L-seryl-tRNA(Sec) selenium transferase n=1 Tax=Paraferrimonas sedimenticola TaxID=375674 RepID=A0AA37RYB6_9GAMM|nr:L-seryl-tRNA(Sec) selenium transferase [Paraferrimonas sedimenticola]GLP97321.1 L-seryl-tRNA(Sec) selenium transferase [Paraferrimonas sedimenticola]
MPAFCSNCSPLTDKRELPHAQSFAATPERPKSKVTRQGNSQARLPQIDKFLSQDFIQPYVAKLSRPVVTNAVRAVFAELRAGKGAISLEPAKVNDAVCARLDKLMRVRQQRVINATGTIIHTNLGRSPIHPDLWEAAKQTNTHYCNLELALAEGKRGQRKGLLPTLLQSLTGGEDALVVNNNACSVYLLLLALAQGKEVIVSRGEQIQIGGGFRIPDILAMSGAKLVEVGTTNITTCDDYLDAITDNTAMVLMVHQSNFAIRGFTQSVDIKALRERLPEGVVLAVDQGSGVSDEDFCPQEKSIVRYLKQGADLVCFSGDKILGGPQAGIVCGRGDLIRKLETNPMMRAFRPGRIILSLLEELLIAKLNRQVSGQGVSQRMLAQLSGAQRRAESLQREFPHQLEAIAMDAVVGGGTLPDTDYPGFGVVVKGNPKVLSRTLRNCPISVIGVVSKERFMLNLSSVSDDDFELLRAQLAPILDGEQPTQDSQ